MLKGLLKLGGKIAKKARCYLVLRKNEKILFRWSSPWLEGFKMYIQKRGFETIFFVEKDIIYSDELILFDIKKDTQEVIFYKAYSPKMYSNLGVQKIFFRVGDIIKSDDKYKLVITFSSENTKTQSWIIDLKKLFEVLPLDSEENEIDAKKVLVKRFKII